MTVILNRNWGNNPNDSSYISQKITGAIQKIYNLSKKTLDYLVHNQHAMAVGLWSFVFTQTIVSASEFLEESGEIYDLSSCNNLLCSHWINETILDHSYDYHDLTKRCLPSHPAYAPIRLYDECMFTLCEYLSDLNLFLIECVKFKNVSEKFHLPLYSNVIQKRIQDDKSFFELTYNSTLADEFFFLNCYTTQLLNMFLL